MKSNKKSKQAIKAAVEGAQLAIIKASVAKVKARKGGVNSCPFKTGTPEADVWVAIYNGTYEEKTSGYVELGTEVATDSDIDNEG